MYGNVRYSCLCRDPSTPVLTFSTLSSYSKSFVVDCPSTYAACKACKYQLLDLCTFYLNNKNLIVSVWWHWIYFSALWRESVTSRTIAMRSFVWISAKQLFSMKNEDCVCKTRYIHQSSFEINTFLYFIVIWGFWCWNEFFTGASQMRSNVQ